MKTIGLLGGMSFESTADYYRIINEAVKSKLGGLNSAKIILNSVNFDEIVSLKASGDWDKALEVLTEASKKIELAGADFILICTNTMHILADKIEANLNIPIAHIADATGDVLVKNNVKDVLLLGTNFTMEKDFYKERLISKFGLNVVIPEKKDRDFIHKVIYEELCKGLINEFSKSEYLRIIDSFAGKGVKHVILGCTEIAMLVNENDTESSLYDTTSIHAKYGVKLAFS